MEPKKLEAGDACPACHYSPLYEDEGVLVCVGCDSRYVAPDHETDTEDLEEEDL